MKENNKMMKGAVLMLLALLIGNRVVLAGTLPPYEEPQPAPEPVRILQDADASIRAYEHRALNGDNFLKNLFERPFTAEDMIYLKDVDIYSASIASDDYYYYFTIALQGGDETTGGLSGNYGIEFDQTKSGRGDLLVLASAPGDDWDFQNVAVYTDTNQDVGGMRPNLAEAGWSGDGYDSPVVLEGDEAVYTRLDPEDETAIQFAVSKELLGTEGFLWGAWAGKDPPDLAKFDFNDSFTLAEAGSPIKPSDDYPLAVLHSLDNTCRLPFGFAATGGIAGMCLSTP